MYAAFLVVKLKHEPKDDVGSVFLKGGFLLQHLSNNYAVLQPTVKLVSKIAASLSLDVKHAIPIVEDYLMSLKLSPQKNAFRDHLKGEDHLCLRNYFAVCEKAIANLKDPSWVSVGIDISECWIAHDKAVCKQILQLSNQRVNQLDLINSYYGSQISTYFSWLDYYTTLLAGPVVIGVALFVYEFFDGSSNHTFLPYFGVFMAIWSTIFLEFWKRRNAELSYSWSTFGVEEDESRLELANQAEARKEALKSVSVQPLKILFSICVTFACTVATVLLMFYFYHLQHHAIRIHGMYSPRGMLPLIVYSLLPPITEAIYSPIAEFLNKCEGHVSKVDAEKWLIFKKFGICFVNRYCALFYVAFWLQDLEKLRNLMIVLLIGSATTNSLLEVLLPVVTSLLKVEKAKSTSDAVSIVWRYFSKKFLELFKKENVAGKKLERTAEDVLHEEIAHSDFEVSDEYLEMVTQYGYVTMFSVAFPLAPLLALINNKFEFQIDLIKLSRSRRPARLQRSTIGAWQSCLEIIGFVSVFTNLFILCIASSELHRIVPSNFHQHLQSLESRYLVMLFLEHILLIFKLVLMTLVNDIPLRIRESLALEFKSSLTSKKKFSDSEENHNNQVLRNISLQKMNSACNTLFGFNPSSAIGIILAPIALQYFNFSVWFHVPLSVAFLLYMQAKKNRNDRMAALGIVSDTDILKIIMSEWPGWIRDSDVEQANWMNGLLRKLWPKISLATEKVVKDAVQKIIKESKLPSIFSSCELSQASLGTIAPVFKGLKLVETSEDVVRLDIELLWAGDPEFLLHVGFNPVPLIIELNEVRISANLRVELIGLYNEFPCFQAINITCMEKPFIDFSLKLANFDVMNLPAMQRSTSDASNLLGNWIQDTVCNIVLFPKKLKIVLNPKFEQETSAVSLLYVTVVRCRNLLPADLSGASDPFVEISLGTQTKCTSTKLKNLNPVYNERFDFVVENKSTDILKIRVLDRDDFSSHDSIGVIDFGLEDLVAGVATEFSDCKLRNVKQGTISVICKFVPLSTETQSEYEEEAGDISGGEVVSEMTTPSPGGSTRSSLFGAFQRSLTSYPEKSSAPDVSLKSSTGVLSICNIQCHKIRAPHSWISKQNLKVFVEFTIPNMRKVTAPRRGMDNFTFEDILYFTPSEDVNNLKVVCKVMEHSSIGNHRLIGTTELVLEKISVMKTAVLKGHLDSAPEASIECTIGWNALLKPTMKKIV